MKPRLLDLFCGAGGAAMGYHRAGFEVVGVDIAPQPAYPFEFVRADALSFMRGYVAMFHERRHPEFDPAEQWPENVPGFPFDAIHASPPCQAYTSLRGLGKTAGVGAPDLVAAVRDLLEKTELPYAIENVLGSPLRRPVILCGSSFGLGVRRHRLFECNFPVLVPQCAHHGRAVAVYGDHPQKTDRPPWRAETLQDGQVAMGIDWMPWGPLTQAIPPAFTEHIGSCLLAEVNGRARVAA